MIEHCRAPAGSGGTIGSIPAGVEPSEPERSEKDQMQSSTGVTGGDIDVAAMLHLLKSRWKTLVIVPLLALAAAVAYLNFASYRYAVQMRLVPIASSTGDGLSSKLSQFGGLAAVAGVALPDSGGSGSFKLYVEALHSRDVAEILASDPKIMHGVFAREWDARAGTWRMPSGLVYNVSSAIKPVLGIPRRQWTRPGAARLQAWMAQQVAVDQNVKSPVVTVSMMSENPAFAIVFLNRLSSTIDDLMRRRALLRTDDYIRYLSSRLPTILLAEQRIAIAQALGEQERLKMVASSDRPYAAEVFEQPAASDRPVTPSPFKVLAIAGVLGVGASLAIVFLIRPRRQNVADLAL